MYLWQKTFGVEGLGGTALPGRNSTDRQGKKKQNLSDVDAILPSGLQNGYNTNLAHAFDPSIFISLLGGIYHLQ